MPIINISVKNKIATLDSCASIVCKNSDYMAHFTFDEGWKGYNVKLAKFIYDDKIIPRVFIGSDCAIPKLPNTYSCLIEVEAGDVKTAAPVHINCIPVSDDEELEETEEHKTSVYNQILELIKSGTLTNATIVKTEFVGKDSDGGNVYKQTFDNGMESFFTAPKGDTVSVEFGETKGTAYEGNKGAKNARDIINILNEILTIKANLTENNSEMAKLILDVKALSDRLNFIANSDDTTLDQLKEVVDFAKQNKSFIESLNLIVNKNSKDLEDFKKSAEETYATKTEVKGINDKVDKIPTDVAWYAKDVEEFGRIAVNPSDFTYAENEGVYSWHIYTEDIIPVGLQTIVAYNGRKYVLKTKLENDIVYAGNAALVVLETGTGLGEDTGEPFAVVKAGMAIVIVAKDAATVTVQLVSDFEQIPEIYLPMDKLATAEEVADLSGAIGDIDTVLDSIIELQNSLIGDYEE